MSESNRGTYVCEISNVYGFVKGVLNLELGIKPNIRITAVTSLPAEPIVVKQGEGVELTCEVVTGNPTPNLSWSKYVKHYPGYKYLHYNIMSAI